jgi:DNA polymerase-1
MVCYGMGPRKLAKSLNITQTQAQDLLDQYFHTFPEIRLVQQLCISKAKREGQVETLFGHVRRFKDIMDKPDTEALNAVVQGTAADIVKRAQIQLQSQLPADCYQLIQVHDELVVEAPVELAAKVAAIVKDCMENSTITDPSLLAEPKITSNWSEGKD